MRCTACEQDGTRVIDSREAYGTTIRRRRECPHCKQRFTTYEFDASQTLINIRADMSILFKPGLGWVTHVNATYSEPGEIDENHS